VSEGRGGENFAVENFEKSLHLESKFFKLKSIENKLRVYTI